MAGCCVLRSGTVGLLLCDFLLLVWVTVLVGLLFDLVISCGTADCVLVTVGLLIALGLWF